MHQDDIQAAVQRHWAASDAGDFATEHEIYDQDAVLDYPQSGERIRGSQRIQASRMAQPDRKRFSLRGLKGEGGLWVSELAMGYGDRPFHMVSIMEFAGGKVIHETQYFAEPFAPSASRARWVERIE